MIGANNCKLQLQVAGCGLHIAAHIDLLLALVELAGVRVPDRQNLDGKSLAIGTGKTYNAVQVLCMVRYKKLRQFLMGKLGRIFYFR